MIIMTIMMMSMKTTMLIRPGPVIMIAFAL